jgi:GNAT superfamily N-acetyltransferase
MSTTVSVPSSGELGRIVDVLRGWQRADAPVQLHPGDLGWAWRRGPQATAAALRVWRDAEEIVAIGFLDGPDVLRATVSPERWTDAELASRVHADVSDPERGVLPAGRASVEAPNGTSLQRVLRSAGWEAGEAWTPLSRDLAAPVEPSELLRVETVSRDDLSHFTAVHRSAWANPTFTDERWDVMSAGAPFADARCLLGSDRDGVPVAGVTVWSAGPGRPGLLEPMGVHADHRREGYGSAICVAAAAVLRTLGASNASVCTPSALESAVRTYVSAGFAVLPERFDCTRTR